MEVGCRLVTTYYFVWQGSSFYQHCTPVSPQELKNIVGKNRQAQLKNISSVTTAPWNRGTVIVVGQGRAGKSAATDALLGNGFRAGGYESTIGAEQCTRSISHAVLRQGQGWGDGEEESNLLEMTLALEVTKRYVAHLMHIKSPSNLILFPFILSHHRY